MKTTVKLLASAVALCIVPATYAITPEQALANLQGAQQFSHLANKSYSTAMYNEHLANLAKGNALVMHGPNSTQAIDASQAYDAALKRVAQTRQDARLGRLQVDAAQFALRTAAPQKLLPQLTPQPMNVPTPITQFVPQKTPVLPNQLTPQPIKVPTPIAQSVPQKTPVLPIQLTPQPMKVPTPIVQSVPQKTPVLPIQLTPQPIKVPTPIVQSVPQKTPVLPTQLTPQPMKVPTPVTQTVPTVNPTLYRQDIAKKQAALIAPPVITPTTNRTVIPVTSLKPSTKVPVTTTSGTNTITTVQHVNTYYIDQATRSKVSNNSDAISQNSQKIDRNAKDIEDTRDDLKRGLNNAAAMSSLHYHSDNAWALSTGTANGDGAALAGGLQKGLTSHVAVNMQASTSFDSGWMAGAGISGDF
ncbi:YadA domain-containing protein [Enterobacter soli]|uniref:collagen-binding protein n=1 Tax=Enterobacter soli TaxID=885040 RepID=UPI000223CDF9|nr:collagen-binding protein [Enterobacter soli]AEN63747.1 YadA domain-containing protein [Enterobacter soli]OAT39351.1 proline-rich protein [Enterobacter soli ATCC BAA-2102]